MDIKWIWKNIAKVTSFMESLDGVFKIRRISHDWMYLFRTIPFECIKVKLSKQEKLDLFVALYSWLPVQGSAQWLAQRVGTDNDPLADILLRIHGYEQLKPSTIGGSEVSTIRGENEYQNTRDLVKTKLGMSVFNGSIDTRWGKMMEPVITMYTNAVFDVSIVETGSIPGFRDSYGFPVQSYSPDGLAIVNLNLFKRVIEHENINFTQTLEWTELYSRQKFQGSESLSVLFEFKCPRRRTPKGAVPNHYKSQPQIGQCVIPIMEVGVFGDGLFRKCSLQDFGFNPDYDKWFHCTDRYLKVNLPIVCGFVGIYNIPENVPKTNEIPKHNLGRYVKILYSMVRTELSMPGSDYFYINVRDLKLSQVPGIVGVIYKNLKMMPIYDESKPEPINFSVEEEEILVWSVIKRFFKSQITTSNEELFSELVIDAMNLYSITSQNFDLGDLDFGIDFGKTLRNTSTYETQTGSTIEEFESVMERICDVDSFKTTGYKFYYPERYYHQLFDQQQFSHDDNYVDFTLSEPKRSRKWLWQHLGDFQNFCKEKNYEPIGVIPWKLLKINYTPVWKKNNFSLENEAAIRSVSGSISSIRIQADESQLIGLKGPELRQAKKRIYKPLVDSLFPKSAFPPPKFPKKKKQQVQPSITQSEEPSILCGFTDDDFDQV